MEGEVAACRAAVDEGHNGRRPEGPHHQPLSTPAEVPQWFFRTSAPCLNATWLQPLVPTLVVQPASRTAVTLNYLPPQHTSLLQPSLRRDKPSQIPQSIALRPSIPGWGVTSSIPGPFIGPISSEYCSVEQWHAHLQPEASHQRTKVADAPPDTQEDRGIDVVQTGGGQGQVNNMPTQDVPSRTKTCVPPITASSSLALTLSPGKELIEIIDRGFSGDAGILGAQRFDPPDTLERTQVMETKIPSRSKGVVSEEWKKGMLTPAETVKRDVETEKLPPKKRWGKRKMDGQASPMQPKTKIHVPGPQIVNLKEKALDRKVSASRSKGPQVDKKNAQPKKTQVTKAMNAKNKMQAKPSTEPLKPVPKSNLALRMMESVQIFYPLGKSNVAAMPARKAPANKSSAIPSINPVSTSAWPVPKALPMPLPKPVVKPLASTLTKAMPPPSLPKPPPSSLAKPSLIPVPVPQPIPRVKPQPTSLKRNLPSAVGRISTLEPQHGISMQQSQRPSHSQAKGPETLQFHQRTLPRDHGLVLKYSVPPPVLPFELAFRNWKPPPKDLEVSTPITEEQRPRREMMKRQAQREREEAAQWTSVGRVQFFVKRKKEKDIADMFGYP